MSTTSSGTQQFPQQPRSSGSIAAANCPGCSRGFDTLSMQIACRACGASHHFDCWAGGHGCSVAGCPESQAAQAAVPAYAAGYAHPTAPLRQAVTHAHPQQLVPWVGGAVATTQVRRNMGFSPLEVIAAGFAGLAVSLLGFGLTVGIGNKVTQPVAAAASPPASFQTLRSGHLASIASPSIPAGAPAGSDHPIVTLPNRYPSWSSWYFPESSYSGYSSGTDYSSSNYSSSSTTDAQSTSSTSDTSTSDTSSSDTTDNTDTTSTDPITDPTSDPTSNPTEPYPGP